jgi:site-specific DNA-cytosine methylase
MKAVGITCGIGSMLIGARQADFDVVGNIEWRKYYHVKDAKGRNTFTENFPRAFLAYNYSDITKLFEIDLALGHPECGNYSIMNQSRQKKERSPGDIPLFAKLIQIIKPRFFVQDNLARSLLGYTIQQWHGALPQYDLFPEWISNYHYGNIQKSRNRFFLIGALKKENFVFIPGEKENKETLQSCLKNCKGLLNHNYHIWEGPCGKNRFNLSNKKYGEFGGEKAASENATWEEFQCYFDNQPDGHVMLYVTKEGIIRRRIGTSKGYWEGHSHLLDGSSLATHPRRNLPFTLRERARIQGCPDDFIFYGEKLPWNHEKNSDMIKQTGKFMPVQFCTYISKQIAAHIKKKKFRSSGNQLINHSKYIDEAKTWYCENVGYNHQKQVCKACWLKCKK